MVHIGLPYYAIRQIHSILQVGLSMSDKRASFQSRPLLHVQCASSSTATHTEKVEVFLASGCAMILSLLLSMPGIQRVSMLVSSPHPLGSSITTDFVFDCTGRLESSKMDVRDYYADSP